MSTGTKTSKTAQTVEVDKDLLSEILEATREAKQQWSVTDMKTVAKEAAESKMFSMTEAQAFMLMQIAQAEGIHPVKALQRYHISRQGRPIMKAEAVLADFQKRGGSVKWITESDDRELCEAFFSHPRLCPEGKTVRFSLADAKAGGVAGNDTWRAWTPAMLRARVSTIGVRMIDPGILAGMYTEEEQDDIPDAEPERNPRAAANNGNDTGHGSGAYASPETITSFRKWRDSLINEVDQKWLDHITDKVSGEVNQSAGDPFDPKNFVWQLSGHLLKWAKAKDLINAPDGITHNKREQFLATVWQRNAEALDVEAREYCRGLWKDANAKLKRQRQPGDDDDLAAQDEVLDAAESTS